MGLDAFRTWYAPTTVLHRGSASDGKLRPRVGYTGDASVETGDAEGHEARAWVLLGVDTWVVTGRGANTRLGPIPAEPVGRGVLPALGG